MALGSTDRHWVWFSRNRRVYRESALPVQGLPGWPRRNRPRVRAQLMLLWGIPMTCSSVNRLHLITWFSWSF